MNQSLDEFRFLHPLWLVAALFLFAAFWFIRRRRIDSDWRRVLPADVIALLRWHSNTARAPADLASAGDDRQTIAANGENLPLEEKNPDKSGQRLAGFLLAALAAAALAEPAVRKQSDEAWLHTSAIIVIADLSRSMTLSDLKPDRLSRLRDVVLHIGEQAGARSLALIGFAHDAYLLSPPAFDRELFSEQARLLEHGLLPEDGSDLSRALALASDLIASNGLLAARLVIVADAGAFSDRTEAFASRLSASGHRVDVVLAGESSPDRPLANGPEQADAVAAAGKGSRLTIDPFGPTDLASLQLDAATVDTLPVALRPLLWQSLSRWLLLLAIPVALWLFLQQETRR